MPICTRVDIDDPYFFATFKLPQIHELALNFSDPDCSTIWEKRIALNANLPGLTLLHMKKWPFDGDLIPILKSLPLLETLVISSRLGVIPFRAFLPVGSNESSGLKQASNEKRALALLCPKLQILQIEGQDPLVEPELMPILKDIVALHAEHGSPLKHLTFSKFRLKPGSRFELIGRNGNFMMEKIFLPQGAKEFNLNM
jgi:hypothetical protein